VNILKNLAIWFLTIVVVALVVHEFLLEREIQSVRAERIASDSLRKVAESQYEVKVREVNSEREMNASLKQQNKALADEFGKRDVEVREITSLVLKLWSDSAKGKIEHIDTAKGETAFSVTSNDSIVTLNGIVQTKSPYHVWGEFLFANLPPVTIVLYEDELHYINARVHADDKVMSLVSFHVEQFKPQPTEEGLRFILGAGPARTFDSNATFGLSGVAGVTWRTWGIAGIVFPNGYGVQLIKRL
jgi:hypothetical protein